MKLVVNPATEIQRVQNPALGAFLLWQFGLAFQDETPTPPALPLHFLVLPLVLHHTSLGHISSTRPASGLVLFVAKLGDLQEDLLAVHERALALRTLTTVSIGLALRTGIVSLDYQRARLRSNAAPTKPKLVPPERLKAMHLASRKLGAWFARLELAQIASLLRVAF